MARIQYQPAARSRGFAPPKLSTAAIDRMRDESNRLIQGMERRRRAEREQDRQDLQAMQSNAEYTRDMEEVNFKTRLYNEEQKNKQELAKIASQAKKDQAPYEILQGLAAFAPAIGKELASRAKRDTERRIAIARTAELGDIEGVASYFLARRTQTNGSIQLNAEIAEDAALKGQDPVETLKNHVANPAIVGASRRVYDNRTASSLYNTLLDKYTSTTDAVFTAPNGEKFSGMQARRDTELMSQLHDLAKQDMFIAMGNPKATHLMDAIEAIDKGNEVRINNVRNTQFDDRKSEAREQINTLYYSTDIEDHAKAYDQNWRTFGRPDAIKTLVEKITNAETDEQAKKLMSLPISKDGKKTFAEERPDLIGPALAERDKLQRQREKAEDEQNKLDLLELVDNNMPAIYADFQRAPHDAMALWTENSAKQFNQPVPSIVKNIYSQALKNNKQDEANDIELLAARGMLDSGYVNNITDSDNLKLAKGLYEQQQIRKYGQEYVVVEDAIDDVADTASQFSSQFAGDTNAMKEMIKINLKAWAENDLKITGSATATIAKLNEHLKTAHTNDINNPLAYTDTTDGRNFRYIGKVDPEQSQKASYLARVSKNRSVGEIASQPYLLMNADQVREASFRSSRGLPMEITPEIMQTRDMFGGDLTYSELINEQIDAHNKVTGENVPLITQTPAVKLMDNLPLASAKLFQAGMKNGSKAQMDRALSPFTNQVKPMPVRTSMVQNTGMRGLANLVSGGEGSPTSMFPGEDYPEMTNMTIKEVVELQKEKLGDGRASAAVGAYQFLYPETAAQRAGLSLDEKFTPENQLKMFAGTLLNKPGRENVSAFLQGTGNDIETAIDELSQEFASIEYRDGRSYYDDGVNKASISRDQVRAALLSAREELITQ